MAKSSKKIGLLIPLVVILIVVAIVGVIFGVSQYRKAHELKLSNANEGLNNVATEIGIVDKDEDKNYITLYVTAGVILIAGVAVFIYVYKKAEE